MKSHYHVIVIKCPVVTSACTIDGADGYGTPISCSDQIGSQTIIEREYFFTDWNGPIANDSPVYNNVLNIRETPPELKSGNGLASRSTLSVSFSDFKGDPNEDSPAVVADPAIIDQGTFFGKLDERQILKNKQAEVRFFEYNHSTKTSTLLTTHYYYIDLFQKRKGRDEWSMSCKDLLFKSDDDKAKFPIEVNESIVNAITNSQTTIEITNNNNLVPQDWIDSGVCVIGKDVMLITNAAVNGSNIDLTVTRSSTLTVGTTNQNTFSNTPEAAEAGENVFKGQLYEDALIADVIIDHLEAAQITKYNATDIQNEIAAWISNPTLSTIYFESTGVNESLNNICELFVLDVFADVVNDEITILANSPWKTPKRTIIESLDFDYNTTSFVYKNDLRVSNAVLRYYKKSISEAESEREYRLAAQGIDLTLDGSEFYGESPTKKFKDTFILGNSLQDTENASLTVTRHVQRFADRPLEIKTSMSEEQLGDLILGDVVNVESEFKQDFSGSPKTVRSQITRISPSYKISRMYDLTMLSYDPQIGNAAINVIDESDINLFLLAGAPPSGEYTFIFDGNQVGTGISNAIVTGNFVAGSTVNVVLLNGADLQAKGGNGGKGGNVDPFEPIYDNGSPGLDGELVFQCNSAITVNIYLSGSHTVQGENYTCSGNLLAPGGGGGGGAGFSGGSGSGGGGGAGRPFGTGGLKGVWLGGGNEGENGDDGTNSTGGQGGQLYNIGGDGGNHGTDGTDGTPTVTGGTGGIAGSAIQINSATVNVYGATIGTNYVQGNGDTPNFIA